VLPRLLEVAGEVPLAASDPLREEVSAQREELFDFYRASLLAIGRSDPGTAVEGLRAVLARDPQNAYYRYLVFGGS
jgi:hypothetical protein